MCSFNCTKLSPAHRSVAWTALINRDREREKKEKGNTKKKSTDRLMHWRFGTKRRLRGQRTLAPSVAVGYGFYQEGEGAFVHGVEHIQYFILSCRPVMLKVRVVQRSESTPPPELPELSNNFTSPPPVLV